MVIGSLGTQSGVVGNQFIDGTRALQAWVSWINRGGGLGGHPVRLIIGDDGGDPARNRALTQEMVETRKVIAFVFETAPLSGHASLQYLEEANVPVIGSAGASAWVYQSRMYFPQMASSDAAGTGVLGSVAPMARAKGLNKVGILSCVEAQACKDIAKGGEAKAPEFGLEVVYRAQVSLTQPSFTAECLSARNAGVEVLFPAVDNNSLIRLGRSCASVSYKPLYALPHAVLESIKDDPNLQGSSVSSPVRPWFITGVPAVAEFHEALAGAGIQVPTVMSMAGWTAAKLFEAAAARLPAQPSARNVLEGLWALPGDDLGGLTYPLRYAPGAPAAKRACWFPVRIEERRWVDASEGTIRCI